MSVEKQLSRPLLRRYRRAAESVLSLLESRVELLGLELRQEQIHATRVFIMAALGAVLLLIALLFLTSAAIWFLPAAQRGVGLLIAGGAYAILAGIAFWRVRVRISRRPDPFEDILAELREDLKCF